MSVIISDNGFYEGAEPFIESDGSGRAVELASDANPAQLEQALIGTGMITIEFPRFDDGRGFTLAQQARRLGYVGRLRARGHLIADQYAMARRAGFDEVEIEKDLAIRQPEGQWLARANWRAHDYQSRLRT